MGKSDPIKYTDMAEEGAFSRLQQDIVLTDEKLKEFEKTRAKIISMFKDTAKNSAKIIAGIDEKSIEGVRTMDKELNKLRQTKKAINDVDKVGSFQAAKDAQTNKLVTDSIKANAQAQTAARGSVAALRAELKILNLEWVNMADITTTNKQKFADLTKEIAGKTEQMKKLEEATGNHTRSVGNYQKGLKGLTGVLIETAKALGLNAEWAETLKEAHKEGFKVAKETKEAIHELGLFHKKEAEAAEEAEKAEKELTAARKLSLGVIGGVAIALALVTAAVYAYIEASEESEAAQNAMNRAMDGTVIKDEELRKSYNEHIIAVHELANEYHVLNGRMTEYEAKLDNVRFKAKETIQDIENETTKEIHEKSGGIFGFFDRFFGIDMGSAGSLRTAQIYEEALKLRDEKVKAANNKLSDEEKRIKLEEDKEVLEMLDRLIEKEEEKEKKKLERMQEAYKKHLAALKKLHEKLQALEDREEERVRKEKEDAMAAQEQKEKAERDKYQQDKINEVQRTIDEMAKIQNDGIKRQKEADKQAAQEKIEQEIAMQEEIVNILDQGFQRRIAMQKNALQLEASMIESEMQSQIALAQAGQKNMLDSTLKAKADNIAAQKELDRKARIEQQVNDLIRIFMEYEKAFIAGDPNGASAKAFVKMLEAKGIATGIEAIFAEEGGILGENLKGDYSLFSKRHKSGKDVIVQAEEGEGIVSREDMAALRKGEIRGWMKNVYGKDTGIHTSFSESMELNGLRSEIQEFTKAIKDRPTLELRKDQLGNVWFVASENGRYKHYIQHPGSPIIERAGWNE